MEIGDGEAFQARPSSRPDDDLPVVSTFFFLSKRSEEGVECTSFSSLPKLGS